MTKRARLTLLALLLFLLALIALLFTRCTKTVSTQETADIPPGAVETTRESAAAEPPAVDGPVVPEELTPATLQAPGSVVAGAKFKVAFTGPKNREDYITLVEPGAASAEYGSYMDIRSADPVELTAPIAAGAYELRYVAGRSKTVLGKAPITITAANATVSGPAEAVLGTNVSVSWTGPNNHGDYVTVVAAGTPDGEFGNYTETNKGSPLTLMLPVDAGPAELRYMTGQGAKVLARSLINITTPEVRLTGPARVIAGSVFQVSWTGPNNHGDYVTIVPKDFGDGKYANYTETARGSPLKMTAIIDAGPAELRYMTGVGARVLSRRPLEVVAAEVSLDAPDEVIAGAPVQITWRGPNNHGDYLTVVPQSLPDGQYARYAEASKGSPSSIESPKDAGPAEIRYMSGQGSRVLARKPIQVTSAK